MTEPRLDSMKYSATDHAEQTFYFSFRHPIDEEHAAVARVTIRRDELSGELLDVDGWSENGIDETYCTETASRIVTAIADEFLV